MCGAIPSLPQIRLHGVVLGLNKAQGQLYLYFTPPPPPPPPLPDSAFTFNEFFFEFSFLETDKIIY
jgi:hypothetical protein